MKKLQQLLCAFSVLVFVATARAETPADTTVPAPATPAATDSSTTADATAQPVDPAKAAEIRKLLELTGTLKMTHQMMDQMISSFRMQNSAVSTEFWDRFEKEMNLEELVDKMIPIYAKYYTLDDLKAINAFYETPVGQKVLAATPSVMHESMAIGQNWGRGVALRLMAELKEEREKKESNSAPAVVPSATAAPAPAQPPASN